MVGCARCRAGFTIGSSSIYFLELNDKSHPRFYSLVSLRDFTTFDKLQLSSDNSLALFPSSHRLIALIFGETEPLKLACRLCKLVLEGARRLRHGLARLAAWHVVARRGRSSGAWGA